MSKTTNINGLLKKQREELVVFVAEQEKKDAQLAREIEALMKEVHKKQNERAKIRKSIAGCGVRAFKTWREMIVDEIKKEPLPAKEIKKRISIKYSFFTEDNFKKNLYFTLNRMASEGKIKKIPSKESTSIYSI
jgi:hypothetical protein